jgi:hypothetical protein
MVVVLAARGETPAAFDGRCILAGGVAPRSNTPGILGRRALPARRLARLGATLEFHHGLLGVAVVAAFVAFALSLLLVKVAMKSTRFRRRVEQKAGLTSKDSCRASRDTILGWTKTGPGTAVAMGVSTSVGMS